MATGECAMKQPFHLVKKRPQLRIVYFFGMLLHAGNEDRIGKPYKLATKPVVFIVNLFEIHACIDVMRCSFGSRVVDLVSEKAKKDVDKRLAHDATGVCGIEIRRISKAQE
jgi:hypothetical protein